MRKVSFWATVHYSKYDWVYRITTKEFIQARNNGYDGCIKDQCVMDSKGLGFNH